MYSYLMMADADALSFSMGEFNDEQLLIKLMSLKALDEGEERR